MTQYGGMYEFGPFRYDAEQKLLFRDGAVVALVPKAADTLQVLLERRGRVVEKSELIKLVWPDTQVEEIGLARNISLLRKAFGDDAESYIETIPKRGYRFVAEAPQPKERPRKYWGKWAGVLAAICILAGLTYWQFYLPSRYLRQDEGFASLAVVPFENLDNTIHDAFTDGLNALLPAALAKLEWVHVVSPTTVRRYQHAGVSTGWMGRLLGLSVLVEGTVQRIGGKLRVTARLVDVHTGKLVWAERYDYSESDLAGAQTAAVQAIVAQVDARLAIHPRSERSERNRR